MRLRYSKNNPKMLNRLLDKANVLKRLESSRSVFCQICGFRGISISGHIQHRHQLSTEEYRRLYPKALVAAYKERPPIQLKCKSCGRMFLYKGKRRNAAKKRKYCSPECQMTMNKLLHPPKERLKKPCPSCGQLFIPIYRRRKTYCSLKCLPGQNEFTIVCITERNLRLKLEAEKRRQRECLNCGKQYSSQKNKVGGCSPMCRWVLGKEKKEKLCLKNRMTNHRVALLTLPRESGQARISPTLSGT